MKTSYTPVISISRPPAQPKRAGPLITIRTSTFAQLLKSAQAWDNRYRAMHRAQEEWLVQSFCFADDFCAFTTEQERRPLCRVGGRVQRFLLYGALFSALFLLLSAQTVQAQGDDFCCGSGGFVGGQPSWNQFPPVPGGNSNAHTGFTGGVHNIGGVHRGDTVTVKLTMDFWGLVPVILSPGAGTFYNKFAQDRTAQNMRWIGPYTPQGTYDHGQLGYFCFECYFQFEVGGGNNDLWLDYTSTGVEGTQFGAHLEVVDIQPAPFVFPAFAYTQAEKDHAGQLADTYNDAAFWLGNIGTGLFFVPGQEAGGFAFGVFAAGFGIAAKYQKGIHDDPWTDAFAEPYDGAYFDQWNTGLGSCDSAWPLGDGFLYYCNDFIYQMVQVAFYGDFAAESANRSNSCLAAGAGCEYWQKDRAIYGGNRMGDAFANAAGDMWVMRWILDTEGVNNDTVGWDISSFTVYVAELLGDAANFWQGVQ